MDKEKIYNLEIKPSQFAQDLLAAFHMGAQTVLATLAPNQTMKQPLIVNNGETAYDDFDENEMYEGIQRSMSDISRMDPLQREAILSSYGLEIAKQSAPEPDPTYDNLKKAMEEDGIIPKESETKKDDV